VHYAVSIDQIHEACVVIHGLAFHAFCRSTFESSIGLTQIRSLLTSGPIPSCRPPGGWEAVLAYFAGDPMPVARLLTGVPDGHENNAWTLTAATYESLWITGDFDLASVASRRGDRR